MVKLRFEVWESPDSLECAAVSESWDRVRDDLATRLDVFYASTMEEAMKYHHERNGWEPYQPIPGITDQPFSDDQLAQQTAYLSVRSSKWRGTD